VPDKDDLDFYLLSVRDGFAIAFWACFATVVVIGIALAVA